ncbi:FkbM family methyltransferase, partial [Gramella sp. KN1008]|uniref:FkbM family methyltransferase n=1 Tax=Gramella sp. KN1008 TaxID=2529298 RepID=UPI00103D9882
RNFKKLRKNNYLNNFDIVCERLAISNKSNKQTFYDQLNPNQTTSSLSPVGIINRRDYSGDIIKYSVNTITLSDYIERKSVLKIDLLKIDIESYEPQAIEGLGRYLLKFKPIIILEILNEKVATELNKVIDTNEFQLFHLKKELKAERLEEFIVFDESIINWEWNYIIFHNNLEDKIREQTTLFDNLI